jgi:class 3 adenylate cyclase/pimeloyl-ACP methyl ester carboxylesterase
MKRRLAAILAVDMAGFSRLMERDEEGVLARQKALRREIIDPEIARNNGTIVKTTGDGLLAEFVSAQDSVRCAIDIQQALAARGTDAAERDRIVYRMGVNLGDIVFEGGDIFGDGVNVAARLQALAEPGGVCVSDMVYQTVVDRLPFAFRDMGMQRVKNISRPIRAWRWAPEAIPGRQAEEEARQQIRFAESLGGTRIAWTAVGDGRPVLRAPHYLGHLEYEWRSPVWRPFLNRMARQFRLVRFDQRGAGMSDREPAEISENAMAADLETVAREAGLERHALLGLSQGAAFSIRYALNHPDKVTCLVIVGGYLLGRNRRPDPEQRSISQNLVAMMRDGWGSPNPVFRHFFTSSFIPDAPSDIAASFDELQRVATSTENALRIWNMNAEVDVTRLAEQLRIPVLVLHCGGDRVTPIAEGQRIARTIPGASFVELPGDNHIVLEGTPAFDRLFEEMFAFLERHNA